MRGLDTIVVESIGEFLGAGGSAGQTAGRDMEVEVFMRRGGGQGHEVCMSGGGHDHEIGGRVVRRDAGRVHQSVS